MVYFYDEKDDIKNNRESYQNNKDATNIIYNSKDEDDKTKILKGLFNLRFKDFLTAYLNDETEIKIFGDIIISLNGFKTYKNTFNLNTDFNNNKKRIIA